MTRFNITLDQAILFSLNSFSISRGGEIFVPKLSSFKVKDFTKAMSSNCKIIETGIRPGEKLHEEMISKEDALNAIIQKPFCGNTFYFTRYKCEI